MGHRDAGLGAGQPSRQGGVRVPVHQDRRGRHLADQRLQGRQHALNYGLAVLYLFTTAIHSGLLGALLTFARTVWYPAYAGKTESWGLTPLEDQQLGGLIMWVPACTVYIVAGLALFAAWLRESETRVLRREAQALLRT